MRGHAQYLSGLVQTGEGVTCLARRVHGGRHVSRRRVPGARRWREHPQCWQGVHHQLPHESEGAQSPRAHYVQMATLGAIHAHQPPRPTPRSSVSAGLKALARLPQSAALPTGADALSARAAAFAALRRLQRGETWPGFAIGAVQREASGPPITHSERSITAHEDANARPSQPVRARTNALAHLDFFHEVERQLVGCPLREHATNACLVLVRGGAIACGRLIGGRAVAVTGRTGHCLRKRQRRRDEGCRPGPLSARTRHGRNVRATPQPGCARAAVKKIKKTQAARHEASRRNAFHRRALCTQHSPDTAEPATLQWPDASQ